MQRLRVRYAKRGRLRFTSHRDFARAFERAVQRAALPVAYSSGFSPHPRISYANATPTGAASEAEYLEIGLREIRAPGDVHQALDQALPKGLDVIEVVVATPGALADRLTGSRWRVELPGVVYDDAAAAVERFLSSDRVEVQRLTKRGMRTFDCREAVMSMRAYDASAAAAAAELPLTPGAAADSAPGGASATVAAHESGAVRTCAILDMVVRQGTPAVRPDDILTGLRQLAGLEPPTPPLQTRIAQGPIDPMTGDVGDPLASDRDASASAGDR